MNADDGATDLPLLVRGARELGIELSEKQLRQFGLYLRELLEWNQRMNLTAITATEDVQVKHFLDSLTVLAGLPKPVRQGVSEATVLDVGAGAGFPGIPLGIVLPSLSVTLLEATRKKCKFLEHLIGTLGLAGATVACGRAEEWAHRADARERYDVALARAVAPLAVLAELCLPFVRLGGRMIAPKKLGIDEEIRAAGRAIKLLGGKFEPPLVVRLPILDESRQLVVISKIHPTPSPYPRRPGLPAKSPL